MNENSLCSDEIQKVLKYKKMPIYIFDSIDSTNDEAKRRDYSDTEYALFVSDTQTAGRGRLGRSFFSPAKTGLYMSIVFKTNIFALNNPMLITLKAALAVSKVLTSLSGLKFGIKWVNDIYLGNKKVCGILAEGLYNKKDGCIDAAVVGIGINITTSDYPYDIKMKAGSLDYFIDRNILAAEIVNELLPMYENIEDISFLDEYRKNCIVIGKNVSFEHGRELMYGKAVDIADNGGLVVETSDNIKHVIIAGNIEMNF